MEAIESSRLRASTCRSIGLISGEEERGEALAVAPSVDAAPSGAAAAAASPDSTVSLK